MGLRHLVPAAAVAAAAIVLAAPASSGIATAQVNVNETATGCRLTLTHQPSYVRLVLFHIVNFSGIPRGIIVRGAKSAMVPAKQEGNLYYKFPGTGTYSFKCTANTYGSPQIMGRGVIRIGPTGRITIVPAAGGSGSAAA
jgi:hypothetical protein